MSNELSPIVGGFKDLGLQVENSLHAFAIMEPNSKPVIRTSVLIGMSENGALLVQVEACFIDGPSATRLAIARIDND